MHFNLKTFVKVVFFLSLGVFFIWIFLRGLTAEQKNEIIQHFKEADYRWILLSVLIGLVSHISRTVRWQMLLEPLGKKPRFINAFMALIIAYFANLAVPRLGEVARCSILQRYEKIPFEKSFGTVVTERALDLLVFFVSFILAIIWHRDKFSLIKETSVFQNLIEKYHAFMQTGLTQWVVILLLVLAAFLLFRFRKRFARFAFVRKILDVVEGLLEGIKSLGKVKSPFWFVIHTLFIWAMYWLMTWVVFFSLPGTAHLDLSVALLVLVFGTIGIILVQGGIGIYPLLVTEVLMMFGVSKTTGYAMGWLLWTGQTLMIIVAGTIAMVLLPLINKK